MIDLIGGEMLGWSDPAAVLPPALLATAAAPAPAGRTLVAGAHDPALIDALPATSSLTLLVRGLADAEALAARFADRPGVTICCGSLEKLAVPFRYDSVLALAGLDRLLSVESDPLSWDATLSLLLSFVDPAGRVLLNVENPFGLGRVSEVPPAVLDVSGPTGVDELRGRLEEAGLPVVRDYAAYPARSGSTVLIGREALADPAVHGLLSVAVVADGVGPAAPSDLTAAADARLVDGALRHGLADGLAPSWVLLAGDLPPGPAAVLPSGNLQRRDGRWELSSGAAAPVGRTLGDLLRHSSVRRDLPTLRQLLRSWQSDPSANVPAEGIVVSPDGVLHPLAPADSSPLVALRRFARSLFRGGYADLWPGIADEESLTALLAGMTGREVLPAEVPALPDSPPPSARELTVAVARLEREVAEARAQRDFLERTIASRDAELKRARQLNAALAATVPGRAAMKMVGGLKLGRRAIRAVARRTRG